MVDCKICGHPYCLHAGTQRGIVVNCANYMPKPKPQTNAEVVQEWIPVTERLPGQFVSVIGYMTDAGDFPPVRECYVVGRAFYFPALCDVHPVTHWMPLPEPPMRKGENDG